MLFPDARNVTMIRMIGVRGHRVPERMEVPSIEEAGQARTSRQEISSTIAEAKGPGIASQYHVSLVVYPVCAGHLRHSFGNHMPNSLSADLLARGRAV